MQISKISNIYFNISCVTKLTEFAYYWLNVVLSFLFLTEFQFKTYTFYKTGGNLGGFKRGERRDCREGGKRGWLVKTEINKRKGR